MVHKDNLHWSTLKLAHHLHYNNYFSTLDLLFVVMATELATDMQHYAVNPIFAIFIRQFES